MALRLKTLVVQDSRLPGMEADRPTQLIMEGPADVQYRQVTPADPTNTNPTFNLDPPTTETGVARDLRWQVTGTWTVTGTALNQFQVNDRVALAQMPLQSMCGALSVTLNNSTVSLGSISQVLPALMRVGNPTKNAAGVQSGSAAAADWTSDFEMSVGALNSPFRAAGDMEVSDATAPPRTIGITNISVNGGFTEMTITATMAENLIIPPLSYTGAGSEKAVYGLTKLTVSAIMRDFHRGLSLAIPAGATVTGVTFAPTAQSILAGFVTPSVRSGAEAMLRDRSYLYDYTSIQDSQTTLTGAAVAVGTSVTGASNSITFKTIPEKIIIAAMYSEADRMDPTQSLPAAFMPISQISISAGTRSGLLSAATQVDLWALSQKSGAAIPWSVFNGVPQVTSSNTGAEPSGSGGPIVLDVAQDLSLPDGIVPGMTMQWQFAVQSVTATNRYGIPVTAPRLIVIALTGGVLELRSGTSQITEGGVVGLDAESFASAPKLSSMQYHKNMADAGFGGGPFGDFFKGVGRTLERVADPAIAAVSAVNPELGLGLQVARSLTKGGAPLGGALIGGRRMRRPY